MNHHAKPNVQRGHYWNPSLAQIHSFCIYYIGLTSAGPEHDSVFSPLRQPPETIRRRVPSYMPM